MEKRRGSPLRRAVLFRFMRRSVCRNRSRMQGRSVAGPDGSEVSVSVRGALSLRLFPPPAAFPVGCCVCFPPFLQMFFRPSFLLPSVAMFPDCLSGRQSFCCPVTTFSGRPFGHLFRAEREETGRMLFGGSAVFCGRGERGEKEPFGLQPAKGGIPLSAYSVEVGAELPGVGRAAFAAGGGKGLRSAADSAVRRRRHSPRRGDGMKITPAEGQG